MGAFAAKLLNEDMSIEHGGIALCKKALTSASFLI